MRKKTRRDLEGEVRALKRKLAADAKRLAPTKKRGFKVPVGLSGNELSAADQDRLHALTSRMFRPYMPPPGMFPKEIPALAQDESFKASAKWASMALDQQIVFAGGWTSCQGYGAFAEGQEFLGYPYLSELAQRPEYRTVVGTIVEESWRKGIRIKSTSDDKGKADKIKELEAELDRLKVTEAFMAAGEGDGYFGRGHVYLDFDDAAERNPGELVHPVGDGRNEITKAKVKKGSLKRLQPVEAVWCYPTGYNANNPLSPDWYNPKMWYAMGTQVHASRLLPFVGRKVPDLLKPAYSFGGLALTQMAKPYVDNWLRTRQSVSDLVHSFTVWCLATDLGETLTPGGDQLLRRISLFNNMRDNKGMMVTDKDTEEFKNISASVSGLEQLQAQAQEHMMSVARIPAVKFTGIQPLGLNASSEGEMRAFYDTVLAHAKRLYGPNLDRVFAFAQINIWGAVDDDLTYEWIDLWEMNAKEKAEIRKIDADTDAIQIESGVIDAQESRERVAADSDSPHAGLDLTKVIEQPEELGHEGEPGQGGGLGGEPDPFHEEVGEDVIIPFAEDDAQFEESKHPRDQGGKFTSGGGGGGTSGFTTTSGKPLEAEGFSTGSKLAPHEIDAKVADFLKTPLKGTSSERNKIRAFRKEVGEHNLSPLHMQKLKQMMMQSRKIEKAKKSGQPIPAQHIPITSSPSPSKQVPVSTGEVSPADIEKAKSKVKVPNPYSLSAVQAFNDAFTGSNTPTTEQGLKEKVAAFKALQPKIAEAQAASMAKSEAVAAQTQQSNMEKLKAMMGEMSPSDQQNFDYLTSHINDLHFYAAKAKSRLEQHPSLAKHLTMVEATTIVTYTGSHYGKVNAQLRAGVADESTMKYAMALNRALEKLPPHEADTYRGAVLPPETVAKYKPGMVVSEHGFTSSAAVSHKAWSGTKFTIKSKTGRKISTMSAHPGEQEVLFPAGSRFKVVSNDGKHIVMEQVLF